MKNYLKEAGNIHLSYYTEAADLLGIKYEIIKHRLIAKFIYKDKHWYILNTVTPLINTPSKTIATRKNLTNLILNRANIPVPLQKELKNEQEAIAFFHKHKDIVLKPKQNLGGKGVSIKPRNEEDVKEAFKNAYKGDKSKTKNKVLAEKYVSGENYRLLTLGDKVVGVVKRNKPEIVGDGESSIKKLIELTNEKRKKNSLIPTDKETIKVLKDQGLNLESIPSKNKTVYMRYNTNLTQGGTTEEYSEKIHPYYVKVASSILKELDLKFGGIDLIVEDITKPGNYAVNEVNYNPGLRIHYQVDKGKPIKVAIPILKYIRDKY